MNTFLDKLTVHRLHARRVDRFVRPVFDESCTLIEKGYPMVDGFREGWQLTGMIRVPFWANKAEFSECLKIARKVLVNGMYADVLVTLSELKLAIYNGDRAAALEVVDRIQQSIMGDHASTDTAPSRETQ